VLLIRPPSYCLEHKLYQNDQFINRRLDNIHYASISALLHCSLEYSWNRYAASWCNNVIARWFSWTNKLSVSLCLSLSLWCIKGG